MSPHSSLDCDCLTPEEKASLRMGALHDEICRTFGAIHCPSLDQLDAMLRKYGWTPDERGRLA